MIAGCGLRTRVLDARSRVGMAGPARALRHDKRHRDPDPPTRSRRAALHQPPPKDVLARPRRTQRTEQTAARPVAPATAGLAPHAAALAPPPRRPTLDLPAPTTRPTAHRCADPGARATHGPRESSLGLPKNPRRIGWTRPHCRRLNRVEDLEEPGLDPAPRQSGPSRRQFLSEQVHAILAVDSPMSTPSSCASSTCSS